MEAIIIQPANSITGLGFKRSNFTNCKETYGEKLIQCVEENSFAVKDIFIGRMKHYDVKLIYFDNKYRGLVQPLKIDSDPGVISKSFTRTLSLKMNPKMTYEITIADPKLQFSSYNRHSIPTSLITMKENAGLVTFYMKAMLFVS